MLFENNYNKILLVDDDEKGRCHLTMALIAMGYELYTAANGEIALELFKKQAFPIVITDLIMPGMNGIELLKQIKKISPSTEVIMVSGYKYLDLVVESFRHQAIDFFDKPVDLNTLEVAIKRAKEKITIKKGILDYTKNLEKLVEEKNNQLENVRNIRQNNNNNNKLKFLLNSLPLVVFLIDKNFKITALNNMYKQKIGDYTGFYCYRVGKKHDQPCKGCPALKSLSDNCFDQAEIKYITSAGNERSALVLAIPITGVSTCSPELMIISADISKVKGINENLSSLGLMIGSVSHDIKGLLTGLDGGVYILDSALKKKNQAQAEEGLNMVKKVTSRMKNMVLDILFYSRERELKKETINAGQFVNDLFKIFKSKVEGQDILLQHIFPDEDSNFMFKADSGALISALINVFDNAVDACLADNLKKNHKIIFTFSKQQKNIEIKISDNGTGIDQDDIKNIFTLFHSGKGKKGTGLGLFITDKTIRQHGGNIRVESKKGLGAEFIISIPHF